MTIAGGKSKSSGGKIGGKTKQARAKAGKPNVRKPVSPGKTSPKEIKLKPPKVVKSSHDKSGAKGHSFGMFRMAVEKR